MTYSSNADCDGKTDTGNKSQTQDLLRTIDFHVTVLAIACHDLRQPLQAIVGAHELLARRVTAGSERHHLERSEQGSAQLEEKLDQLVDALQLQQRASRIELEPVRLEYIPQRLALQLDGPAQRRGIDFCLVPTRAVIMSQPVLLDGILPNLARNALDHTPAGGASLLDAGDGGRPLRIEVHDTRQGIPADTLNRVFEPFIRLDATRSEGLGLGLFIVKRAAHWLGHRIKLHSAVGRGSCFSVATKTAISASGQTSNPNIAL